VVASRWPSGLKATSRTALVWPYRALGTTASTIL